MQKEEAAYTSFADVYDVFMSDIPYGQWHRYVRELLRERGICDGLVCELGCGTGIFTRMLAADGYDMIGADISARMLEIAAEKSAGSDDGILYLLQDMREFELYGTVRAVVCVCDSMNYMLREEDLKKVFSLVNNYLDPRGVFLFDLKTAYYFREKVGDCVITEHREEGSLIWENSYYEEEKINQYDLTLFIREENGMYSKHQETHLQRAYDAKTVTKLLEEAGLAVEAVYDACTKEAPRPDSERIYFVARECRKCRTIL